MNMFRFTTFLALMVGGMEVMQPFPGALASIAVDPFRRRQTATTSSSQGNQGPICGFYCDSIIGTVASNDSSPSNSCTAVFELAYFNCFVCLANVLDLTDYTVPQSNVDQLYDQCASLGIEIPVLSFPGQSPNRSLSSVAPPSSQTTVSTITFAPLPAIIAPTGSSAPTSTTPAPTTLSSHAPIPTSSSSSGIRSVETSGFNLITSAMILGLWFCFAVR